MSNLTISPKGTEHLSSRYDDRKGLGYGTLKGKFHSPRQTRSSYPYVDEDPYAEEEFDDEESSNAVRSKTLSFVKNDPFSHKSSDAFYYAAGNTKLSDCFDRPDEVLREVDALGDSMVAIPGMHRKKGSDLGRSGAAFPSGVGSFRRTGTKRGYFSPSPRVKYDDESREEDEPIENLEDLFRKQSLARGEFSSKKAYLSDSIR